MASNLKNKIATWLINKLFRQDKNCSQCKKKLGSLRLEYGGFTTEGYFDVRQEKTYIVVPDLDFISPSQFGTVRRRYISYPVYEYPTDFKLMSYDAYLCQTCFSHLSLENHAEISLKINNIIRK